MNQKTKFIAESRHGHQAKCEIIINIIRGRGCSRSRFMKLMFVRDNTRSNKGQSKNRARTKKSKNEQQ